MTTETTTTQPTPLTPTQLLAAAREAVRAEKLATKAATKAANVAKRTDGVIGTIRSALSNPNGTTKGECLAVLVTKFPDRDPMGMSCTIGIQFSRLSKETPVVNRKIEGRGRVYGFAPTVVFPEVVVSGPVQTPTPPPAVTTPEVTTPAISKREAKRLAKEAAKAAK